MSFTDQQVLEQCQYVMIEAPDLGQTWGSGLWTLTEVVRYLNQRQNRFLKDTHVQIGIADIPVTAGQSTFNLPDDWIATVRVVFRGVDGSTVKELMRSDTWEADYGDPDWTVNQGTPNLYMDADQPVLTMRVADIPDQDGLLQVHYIPLGALLTGGGELMTLPDEYIPSLKYGVLADMFSKVGRQQDATRAEYCASRYMLGIEIAKMLLLGWHS